MAERVSIDKPGDWSRLRFERFRCADPDADEVQVTVKASGVNFADVSVSSMLSKDRGVRNPLALALEYVRTPRFSPFDMVRKNRSVMAFNVSYLFERADIIDEAFDYIISGLKSQRLQILPITEYSFHEVARAHKAIESGVTNGKLVLVH